MSKLTTCFCFDHQAEEAFNFYSSVFKDVKLTAKSFAGENERGGEKGTVRTLAFTMFGQEFLFVNGGSYFKFNDAVTVVVNCETQQEIDQYWEKLTADGGKPVQCGWLKDKFGVSWQIVPSVMTKMMADPDQRKSQKVMQEVLKMVKLEIAPLVKAFES
jgi:predicted 3-demethylubiquinone-9 3-methyltransferase (glyoxalase superfamily)